MIFIETSVFTRRIQELVNDDDFAAFQAALAKNPAAGDVIQGTGGLRKIRMAAKGRGKRGGARVIYYYFTGESEIALLLVYEKSEADDLTPEQKRLLVQVIERWR